MGFTKEMIEKAKAAKSAEELAEIARAEGVELTAEEAKMHFDELHKTGELSDEELDNVSGGRCNSKHSPAGEEEHEEDVVYLYKVGQEVEVYTFSSYTKRATVVKAYAKECYGYYRPYYRVKYLGDKSEEDVSQFQIEQP